jgi:hypothetical protein
MAITKCRIWLWEVNRFTAQQDVLRQLWLHQRRMARAAGEGNDSRARQAKQESTMTPNTQNAAEDRTLEDHELNAVSGGFQLIELLVPIPVVSIIMGMQVPPVQKVRSP